MSDTTTGGGLPEPRKKRKFFGLSLGRQKADPAPVEQVRDPEGLRALIRADRVRRRMTWPTYADFLGVHLSTLHKIATGVHKASEITEAIIREALTKNP